MKAVILGLVYSCWPSGLLAAVPNVVVHADGLSGCISGEELARRVEAGLEGRSVAVDEALRVVVEARSAGGLLARVGWFREESALGERAIESASNDCAELDAAVVFVATTLFEEARDAARPTSKPTAPSETAAPAIPTPRWAQQPSGDRGTPHTTPAPPAPKRVGSAVLAGGSVAVGVLSEASVALRLDSRLKVGKQLSLWLGIQGVPWSPARRVDEAQVDFAAMTATAAACWSFPMSDHAELDGCGGVNGGFLATRGTAIRGDSETVKPLLWPIGALALNAPLWSSLLARAHVAAGPALFRNDYFVEDSVGTPHAVREGGPALCEGGLALGFLLP